MPKLLGDQQDWAIEVETDPVAAGQHDVVDILGHLSRRTAQHDWDYAICLTDLPLRRDRRPIVAEVDHDEGVAVVALPSLGGLQTRRRARLLVAQIVGELSTSSGDVEGDTQATRRGSQSGLTGFLAPVHRYETTTGQGGTGIRYQSTRRRGRFRLVTGMVRTNRPWRLIFGMTSALAAAIATSAFGLSSSTIWQLATQLDPVREVGAALASIVLLVGWLIAAHGLWERPAATDSGHDKELTRLYNISTVATLIIGVACLYLGLFVVNLAIAAFLVPTSLLTSTVGSASVGMYVALAWGFTTMGVIAGALGSSLESDQAVRQAAYGYREQQRRAEREQREEQAVPAPDGDNARRDHEGTRTKDELYADAQRHDIRGRSQMTKQQLLDTLGYDDRNRDSPGERRSDDPSD
ncbi:hypothetical protein [Sciscionella marina]|uniref:hypothetical protein n=1 Tax=Sciscionella marina TaxID=508770 RepID=UPI0006870164|nr:hypothetical protein [Sciscionella marina]